MQEPLHLTELLNYEFRQSLRLQLWRRASNRREGISIAEYQTVSLRLEADIKNGVAVVTPCPLTDLVREAEGISSRYTACGGHRSFDILHVATALVLGAREFLTFDLNQQKLAREAGLIVRC